VSLAAEKRFARIVAGDSLDGAFFFHGDADRLRDEAASRLADAAVDPATRDFNLDVFRGSDVTPESLAAALAMAPVMAARRVVVLHEAERLTPTGCRVIEETLDRFPAGLTLIVTATIPDRSKKAFYGRLKKDTTSLEWSTPRQSEVPGWLIERARDRHFVQLEPAAAEALAAAVGADLGVLDSELEKLAAAAPDDTVSRELVQALVPNVREIDRWNWINLVGERKYLEARGQLQQLLAMPGETAVGLLIGLVEHLLFLGIATEGGAALVTEVLGRIGKPYLKFKARAWAAQARRWTPGEVEHALRLMQEADRQAKTGHTDLAVLENVLLRLEARRQGMT
jgi:DNA polymerase-3 subunit delta